MASDAFSKCGIQSDLQDNQLRIDWENVTCPVCLDFPHNAVLLQCSSYDKGCHPFMCNTDHTLSNCLERFRSAYGLPTTTEVYSAPNEMSGESIPSNSDSCATCPLCRGEVIGFVVIDKARVYLNKKKRCCEEKQCSYVGNFSELQMHAQQEHPNARPSEIDPARKIDWEIFQQSSEIIDVLSTIHSEVPHGVVWGDYVIEYGDDSGDEYEDLPGEEGNWWTSCILYQVFDNFRISRNRRRSRANETRRGRFRPSYEAYLDEVAEYQFDESDDEFVGSGGGGGGGGDGHVGETSTGSVNHHSDLRHRSHLRDP